MVSPREVDRDDVDEGRDRHREQGAGDARDHRAAGDDEHDGERMHLDGRSHEERLQHVTLELLHAEHDDLSVRKMLNMLPGMKEDRAEVYSAALRSVFLTLMYKDEIGEAIFDDTLRVLIRGVVRQVLEG